MFLLQAHTSLDGQKNQVGEREKKKTVKHSLSLLRTGHSPSRQIGCPETRVNLCQRR